MENKDAMYKLQKGLIGQFRSHIPKTIIQFILNIHNYSSPNYCNSSILGLKGEISVQIFHKWPYLSIPWLPFVEKLTQWLPLVCGKAKNALCNLDHKNMKGWLFIKLWTPLSQFTFTCKHNLYPCFNSNQFMIHMISYDIDTLNWLILLNTKYKVMTMLEFAEECVTSMKKNWQFTKTEEELLILLRLWKTDIGNRVNHEMLNDEGAP